MFQRILVPLDGSSIAECVLAHVTAIATAFDAKVTLLRVLGYPADLNVLCSVEPLAWLLHKAAAKRYLDDIARRLREADLNVECVLVEGEPAGCIIQYARAHSMDLIVLSSHGASGLSGWNVSSTVQKVILRSYLSSMIVRAYMPEPENHNGIRYRRVLAPLDGSVRAEYALSVAVKLAVFYQSQLVLAHVVRKPELPRHAPPSPEDQELVDRLVERNRQVASAYLARLCEEWIGDCDLCVRLLVSEDPILSLHDLIEQEQIDLVVMGAHGYSGKTRWPYGSLASNFIVHGTKPLLVLQDLTPEVIHSTAAELAVEEYQGH